MARQSDTVTMDRITDFCMVPDVVATCPWRKAGKHEALSICTIQSFIRIIEDLERIHMQRIRKL